MKAHLGSRSIGRLTRRFGSLSILIVGAMLASGCGQSKPRGTVGGRVTYGGMAVAEGVVILYSPELGYGNQGNIEPDGTFLVKSLPFGPYRIAVQPPVVSDDSGGKTSPSPRPKEVGNIPAKYRNPSTSGFSCEVAGRRVNVELRMD